MENGPFIDDKHEDLPIIQYMTILQFATKHVYVHGITTTQNPAKKQAVFITVLGLSIQRYQAHHFRLV
jgi:hypothetical protein